MFIRLNRITTDDIGGDSLFERYSNYSKSNVRSADYTDSKTVDGDSKLATGTTAGERSTRTYTIRRPFPWIPDPYPWDHDEDRSISWPTVIKKVVESSPPIRVDMIDTGEAYMIQADLPGYSEDNIKIYINDNGDLQLSAERGVEKTDSSPDFIINERSSKKLERTVSLESKIDIDKCEAEYKNGVLTVILPKDQSDKTRYINIKKA